MSRDFLKYSNHFISYLRFYKPAWDVWKLLGVIISSGVTDCDGRVLDHPAETRLAVFITLHTHRRRFALSYTISSFHFISSNHTVCVFVWFICSHHVLWCCALFNATNAAPGLPGPTKQEAEAAAGHFLVNCCRNELCYLWKWVGENRATEIHPANVIIWIIIHSTQK